MVQTRQNHRRIGVLLALMLAAGIFAWSRWQRTAPEAEWLPNQAAAQARALAAPAATGGAGADAMAGAGAKRDGGLKGAPPSGAAASGGEGVREGAKTADGPPRSKVATPGQNSTERTIEAGLTTVRALRKAGYSQEQASELVSRGLRESLARQYSAQGLPAPEVETKGGGIVVRERRPE